MITNRRQRRITGGTWSLEKVDGISAAHGTDIVLDNVKANTRHQTSRFLESGEWKKNTITIYQNVLWGGKVTHVRDERFERVKHFGTLVRLHRQFRLVSQRRSAFREEHVHQKSDEHVQDQTCKCIFYNNSWVNGVVWYAYFARGVQVSVHAYNMCMIWLLMINGFSGPLFTTDTTLGTIMYVAADPSIRTARQKPLNTHATGII